MSTDSGPDIGPTEDQVTDWNEHNDHADPDQDDDGSLTPEQRAQLAENTRFLLGEGTAGLEMAHQGISLVLTALEALTGYDIDLVEGHDAADAIDAVATAQRELRNVRRILTARRALLEG